MSEAVQRETGGRGSSSESRRKPWPPSLTAHLLEGLAKEEGSLSDNMKILAQRVTDAALGSKMTVEECIVKGLTTARRGKRISGLSASPGMGPLTPQRYFSGASSQDSAARRNERAGSLPSPIEGPSLSPYPGSGRRRDSRERGGSGSGGGNGQKHERGDVEKGGSPTGHPEGLEDAQGASAKCVWPGCNRMTATDSEEFCAEEHGPLAEKWDHSHLSTRGSWLRAAVLGAQDGLTSTAALLLGMMGGGTDRGTLVLAGTSALLAGAFSMGTGEFVSVYAQRDAELADIERERAIHSVCLSVGLSGAPPTT
uniref:Uncharacterized protein n=1 Tax=Chromera velia CCMP2878 TaxID=1169474 RepID=A0A0G4FI42_9ALVE|eukprot:Cvel_17121.t1-p1 / transcript=Cvel_17121.t1 / gene=Cvel_17121 / organism=Chromera_velia_CCMP2878 / gene_product=Vacuolar iron transporter homolog 5, putative / transcript_product=Vacuolar iron transporter homolog 5, putative / location=Cvel_scaffold1350:45372-48705(+) / protein_length=310 / sequence_SO=supercontig / SO=protein_coding / is_pseudo=false